MEIAISANKFLDLLESVIPVASSDSTRPNICTVRLEVKASDYKIRAVAMNGYIISIGERFLGFSDEQEDLEDLQSRNELEDSEYLISKVDAEILALSLKKLGVRRGSEDKTKGRYYIVIRENENKLTISILGLSHVVMEPTLIKEEFPEYRDMIPRSNDNSNLSYLNLRLSTLSYLAKCWGNEKVNIEFFGQNIKVSRDIANQERHEELKNDCLVLRSDHIDQAEPDNQDNFNFEENN